MVEDIIIVNAAPGDSEAVAVLLARQLLEHRIDFRQDILLSTIKNIIADERLGFVLIAKMGNEPIGVAYVAFTWSLEHGGRSAWLEEMYVMPELREQGIGIALLAVVFERARANGCHAIDLEVDKEHARAANLYEREGFKPLSRDRWVKVL